MKAARLLMITLLSIAVHAANAADLPRIGDFALLDQEGKFHQMSWYGDQAAIVIFVLGNGCPIRTIEELNVAVCYNCAEATVNGDILVDLVA